MIITYKHGIYELPHELPRYFIQKLESILDILLATEARRPSPHGQNPHSRNRAKNANAILKTIIMITITILIILKIMITIMMKLIRI